MTPVLALDLEGTLITTLGRRNPRPGLKIFLEQCRQLFKRIVIYTAVDEEDFRIVARELISNGHAPAWFGDIEHIEWQGIIKDLLFIPGVDSADGAIIVDDNEFMIHPEQKSQWIEIIDYDRIHPHVDFEFVRVLELLKSFSTE